MARATGKKLRPRDRQLRSGDTRDSADLICAPNGLAVSKTLC